MELQNSDKILNWLKTTRIPLTEIASKTGLSRSTLYNWLEGGVIRERNEFKILSMYSNDIDLTNAEIEIEGEGEMDARYVIELQKDKIEHLNVEVDSLKTALKEKQAESTHWEELPYDFISEVTLKRKGLSFGRTVDSISDLDRLSEALGYSVSELENLWSIGTFYNFKEHPIDKIVAKETLKEIEKQMTTLPYIFDSIKSMVGDHYIPQPLVYIHKNGDRIGAIAFAKVQWRTLKVTAKVQFLIHMPRD